MKAVPLVLCSLTVGFVGGLTLQGAAHQCKVFMGPSLTSAPFLDLIGERGTLTASGSWVGDEKTNAVNAVSVNCEVQLKTSKATLAQVQSPKSRGDGMLIMDQELFNITNLDSSILRAVAHENDSCLSSTLLIDRMAKSVTMIQSNEDSSECKQWDGYPKTWILTDSWRASHKPILQP
jgi:hypothetical protein